MQSERYGNPIRVFVKDCADSKMWFYRRLKEIIKYLQNA